MISIATGGIVTWILNCRSLDVPIAPSRAAWARLFARIPVMRGFMAKLGARA